MSLGLTLEIKRVVASCRRPAVSMNCMDDPVGDDTADVTLRPRW